VVVNLKIWYQNAVVWALLELTRLILFVKWKWGIRIKDFFILSSLNELELLKLKYLSFTSTIMIFPISLCIFRISLKNPPRESWEQFSLKSLKLTLHWTSKKSITALAYCRNKYKCCLKTRILLSFYYYFLTIPPFITSRMLAVKIIIS